MPKHTLPKMPVAPQAEPKPQPKPDPSPAPLSPIPVKEEPKTMSAPQPILPGGIVVPLYQPDSKNLKAEKTREAEKYSVSKDVPGRINSIVNIHNPSIEVHLVDRSLNTGAVVILAAGGGHNTLNVGTESADFVPFFATKARVATPPVAAGLSAP